ncbi:hypothetical protein LL962_10620 [Xanthomonas sp. NCPPB 1067]|uniref:hypothetical protein n=1 Tax=Xanthomonas sp. NCPPB 1067 TaxID=487524 RepID=UPI001E607528|nr:hypothetical protein [Xanthomonas sp. NCPPB 1067]MCC4587547.1 hypothetical protein [Xanthomonas sp. NCPPB 1067]
MDKDALKELARALALMATTLETRDQRQQAAIERQMAELRGIAMRNGEQIERLVGGAVPRLQQAWQQALDSSLAPASRRLEATVSRSGAALDALEVAHQALRQQWLRRAWIASAGLIVAALLACACTAYLLGQARQELARYRVEARVLRAVAQSDVVLCGDQLCANVDLRGARSGDRKQYRAVRPRP